MEDIAADPVGHAEARRTGSLLFCSGQIGLEPDGSLPDSPTRQFELAFAALRTVLRQHGCDFQDVVDLTTFHVGYPAHMREFIQVKANTVTGAQPTWTAIGVAALGYAGSLVELKAIAQLPDETA